VVRYIIEFDLNSYYVFKNGFFSYHFAFFFQYRLKFTVENIQNYSNVETINHRSIKSLNLIIISRDSRIHVEKNISIFDQTEIMNKTKNKLIFISVKILFEKYVRCACMLNT